jgi:hypothetical protein
MTTAKEFLIKKDNRIGRYWKNGPINYELVASWMEEYAMLCSVENNNERYFIYRASQGLFLFKTNGNYPSLYSLEESIFGKYQSLVEISVSDAIAFCKDHNMYEFQNILYLDIIIENNENTDN